MPPRKGKPAKPAAPDARQKHLSFDARSAAQPKRDAPAPVPSPSKPVTLSDDEDFEELVGGTQSPGGSGQPAAKKAKKGKGKATAKLPKQKAGDDLLDDSDDDLDLTSPWAQKPGGKKVLSLDDLVQMKEVRDKEEAIAQKLVAERAKQEAKAEVVSSDDEEELEDPHGDRIRELEGECKMLLGGADGAGEPSSATPVLGAPKSSKAKREELDALRAKVPLLRAAVAAMFRGEAADDEIVDEVLRGGWLQAFYTQAGRCPEDVARWLFGIVAYGADLAEAGRAADALVDLLAPGGHSFGAPGTLIAGRRTYSIPCQVEWVPTASDLLEALEAAGYDRQGAAPDGGAAGAGGGGSREPARCALVLRVVAAAARYSRRSASAGPGAAPGLDSAGCMQLVEAAVRLHLDPAAASLAAQLMEAAGELVSCVPEREWPGAMAGLAGAVARLGPTHRAPVRALQWLQQLPTRPASRTECLVGAGAAVALAAVAAGRPPAEAGGAGSSGKKKAGRRGRGGGDEAGPGPETDSGSLKAAIDAAEPRLLAAAKAAAQPGNAAHDTVEWWEILSCMDLSDLCVSAAARRPTADDKPAEKAMERFQEALLQIKQKAKRSSTASGDVKARAAQLYAQLDFLERRRRHASEDHHPVVVG